MESVEVLKRRIQTAEDLQSLVKTMKALAAVNIRQCEQAVLALADYNRTVHLGFQVLLKKHPEVAAQSKVSRPGRVGAIVFGSDQGMCGPLNDQIVAFVSEQLTAYDVDPKNLTTMAVGTRVGRLFEDAGYNLETITAIPSSTMGITPCVQDVLLRVEHWHSRQQVERILLFYNQHLGKTTFPPCCHTLLPIDREWLEPLAQEPWPTHVLPTFSMDEHQLFSALVRQSLFGSLYRAFAESMASENASRLARMRSAERNIEERITDLTARFQRQRQMTITDELLDIVVGFEALGSGEPGRESTERR